MAGQRLRWEGCHRPGALSHRHGGHGGGCGRDDHRGGRLRRRHRRRQRVVPGPRAQALRRCPALSVQTTRVPELAVLLAVIVVAAALVLAVVLALVLAVVLALVLAAQTSTGRPQTRSPGWALGQPRRHPMLRVRQPPPCAARAVAWACRGLARRLLPRCEAVARQRRKRSCVSVRGWNRFIGRRAVVVGGEMRIGGALGGGLGSHGLGRLGVQRQ